MFLKIFLVFGFAVAANAQLGGYGGGRGGFGGYGGLGGLGGLGGRGGGQGGYGHGHAVSSQSIVRHETPVYHKQPVVAVLAHQAPIQGHGHGHAVSSQSFVKQAPVHRAQIHSAPIHHAPIYVATHKHEEEYAHPAYKFEYSVLDTHTGDQKNQAEERDGDVVKGYYSLLQPDGHIRTVHYEADKHSGFNAHVTYSAPHHGHGYQ